MDYRYFGILATVILAVGLLFVILKWPQDRHKTFSQHVAPKRSSIFYYATLFALVLPLLILFFTKWFAPHFEISSWFSILVIIASVLQMACTLIPEVGKNIKIHRALAGASAIFLIPALALILLTPSITLVSKIIVAAALSIMILCAFLVIRRKGAPRNFLSIQSSYFAAFLAPIIYISYLQ